VGALNELDDELETHGAYSQCDAPSDELNDELELDDSELHELLDSEDEYFAGIAPNVTSPARTSDGVPAIPTTDTEPSPTTGFTGE